VKKPTLALHRETLRHLDARRLDEIAGGLPSDPVPWRLLPTGTCACPPVPTHTV
jgi:hypothetical protein